MSQQSRPTQGGIPNYLPGSMLPTVRGSSPQFMYNQPAHMQYNITAVPATQHFVPTTIVYPSQLTDPPTGVNLLPSGLQRIYVPLQHLPAHPFSNITAGPQLPSDPAKLLEEQRKFEKERNFQMQQQRLKQFTIAGKKGSLNADNLLDSMFGKPETKKQVAKPSHLSQADQLKESSSSGVRTSENLQHPLSVSVSTSKTEGVLTKSKPTSTKEKFQKDPKELENMMLKFSNISGPQKAKGFQKPAVKEIPKSSPQRATFSVSERAVDWRSLQGLDDVFTAPKPRFPQWCKKERVPPLFLQIQNVVTDNNSHPPDTNVLHSILISSGLPQRTLGEIWEMVNQTSPEYLSHEEMYAVLALTAVAQAGHQVKSLDILHQLPTCPIPKLQYFSGSQASDSNPMAVTSHAVAGPRDQHGSVVTMVASANIRPTSIPSLKESVSGSIVSDIASWSPFSSIGDKTQEADDEFDDFKSATPMAVNAPPLAETVTVECDDDDEFDDFKQAPSGPSFTVFPKSRNALPTSLNSLDNKPPVKDPDLMLPEDKYSVFRMLQQDTADTETSALTAVEDTDRKTSHSPGLFSSDGNCEPLLAKEQNSDEFAKEEKCIRHVNIVKTDPGDDDDDDDFGDFLDASDATPIPSPVPLSSHSQDIQVTFTADFADFSQLENGPTTGDGTNVAKSDGQNLFKVYQDDSDFGEFATFQKSTLKPDLGQEYFFPCNKDNISLAESQSISSLELGTFDGAGHSGESKSSLSRQGSIPSLDLKVAGLEASEAEDEFGDMQSATVGTTASPSPSVETNKSCDEKFHSSLSGLPMQPALNVPLADKYSVIRSEQVFNEDQHISDWTRCIKSCIDILQNATRIFNQMSCSSVCNEVLSTEEGKNYVKNVIEVYKVVCRVSLASKTYEKRDNKLTQLLDDADQAFNTMTVFLSGSSLLPNDAALDFSSGILQAHSENNEKACGVCLLNVDSRSKAFNKVEDVTKLTYGGRQYHCACANLWVNCVDPLLPVLVLPQLI